MIEHNGLHATPLRLDATKRVLDLACGTGVWTTSMARRHPRMHVVGVDLVEPEASAFDPPPMNCRFVVGDIEKAWTFNAGQPLFDFIYGRIIANVIRDWDAFFARCFHHLSPNGWLEVDDVVHRISSSDPARHPTNSPMMRWWQTVFHAASTQQGVDINATDHHADQMQKAGFEVVRARRLQWYCGAQEGASIKDAAIGELMLESVAMLIKTVTESGVRAGLLSTEMEASQAWALADEAETELRKCAEVGQPSFYVECVALVARKAVS